MEVESADVSGRPSVTRALGAFEGWDVTARWFTREDGAGAESRGPAELRISLRPDASPAIQRRGLTSGVLRRIEAVMVESSDDFASMTAEQQGFRRAMIERVRDLPATPRSHTGDYYAELLHLFEVLEVGEREPVQAMRDMFAQAGRPIALNTLKSQLQRARGARAERERS